MPLVALHDQLVCPTDHLYVISGIELWGGGEREGGREREGGEWRERGRGMDGSKIDGSMDR